MDKLEQFVAEFKLTPQWATMAGTVENSPWHREANVAVHTEMVMQQFADKFAHQYTETERKVGTLALLFHDTGKPSAEEVLEKKDGSGEKYRRYAGHEQNSAVTFQECYLQMPSLRALLTQHEARAVRWMIEHHLPYGYKDAQKRKGLAVATHAALHEAGCSYDLFFDCLRSDAAGRISDDHETKLQAVEDWIKNFEQIEVGYLDSPYPQTMYLLVGPSGSGKSTWVNARRTDDDVVISYDTMKLHFWMWKNDPTSSAFIPHGVNVKEHYDVAWRFANENESEFQKFANQMIEHKLEMIKNRGGNVYVDVVNASKKKRAKFVELAKQKKFRVEGVEFWNRFETLLARQKTRDDKDVPYGALKQQLYAICGCWLGAEVNDVQMVMENV